jgi:hypothetical protein
MSCVRKRIWFLILASLCVASLLVSCNRGNDPVGTSGNQPYKEEDQITAVKVFDDGMVIQKEENRLLITKYVNKDTGAYIDAYWLSLNEETVLQNSRGQNIPSEDIGIGAEVEAWHTGPVNESYPQQAAAAKIIVNESSLEQSKAVQAALRAVQEDSAAAWAVTTVSLDEENGYWNVELVNNEKMDQPSNVHVDVNSGQPIPVPVAENDVFRVFSPKPDTQAGPSFSVEGEARVFEAAFSWQLEDGHTILAEGHEMADEGAPAWGHFKFDVTYMQASQPNMSLILFVYSAKDGSVEHELIIPLKVPEEHINYNVE